MASPKRQVIKLVKASPKPMNIKVEVISDDEEELAIQCRLCPKSFCNDVALRNHLRMEHSGEQVDMDEWVQDAKEQKQHAKGAGAAAAVARRTAQLVSSMQPTDILSLASQDVSYIIIKAEPDTEDKPRDRKRKPAPEGGDAAPKKTHRREREIVPITGPFECLQPSTLVADGQCHQIFFSCCDYSIHFRDEHTRRRKAIKCQVCEKVLASTIGEEANSAYPCHVCGAGCATRDELTEHINTVHIKLKPYQCSVCHKRFTQQGGVHQHMRMHTGDRPFNCTFCQKSFTQKSGLDQHLRTHTKVKPYRCVICGKTFVQSVHLKQHMRTHTNVSPFQCVICEKRFKQSSHLNYHLKNHNEANMTDDQKKKYRELIGIINEQNAAIRTVASDRTEYVMEESEEGQAEYVLEENEEGQAEYVMEGEGDEEQAEYVMEGEGDEEQAEYATEEHEALEGVEAEYATEDQEGEGETVILEEGQQVVIEECAEQVYYERVEGEEGEEGEGGEGEGEVILQDDREYILSDNGNETWSVKVVN